MEDKHRVHVLLKKAEHEILKAAAEKAGLALASYIRMAALEKANRDD